MRVSSLKYVDVLCFKVHFNIPCRIYSDVSDNQMELITSTLPAY